MNGLRYVYAVCRPFDAPLQAQVTGVAGAPVGQLPHHGLVAVVSTVPERDFAEEPLKRHLEDLDWLSDTARGHQSVIDALTAVTTPLPLRLATVFRDDSGVRTMLERREETLRRTLDRLDGRVEWGVKIYAESGGGQRAAAPARPASGRDYLLQRRRRNQAHDEMWERAEKFAGRLHDLLSGRAEDSRLHPPQNSALSRESGRNVLNAAYLVSRADSEAFVELVDRTKDEETADGAGLRVELTGPWAAYSFATPAPEEASGTASGTASDTASDTGEAAP
ncbi:GvpL/GvpF family gas vesicle protein [Streptomyces sp. NPDC059786]|uniref:GvpL/GvpF family gas vesicle protein n=1 Tax=Streptomyces sp. NPDC059786 TaxID=3346946 RepID=UPI003668ACEA